MYFREPGDVLFGIATIPPGFMIDEKPEDLGTRLSLPPWLESMCKDLEKVLPPVYLPTKGKEERVVKKKKFNNEEENYK
jgi:glyoxalase family protein